jgi:AraC-like DNA-binding protein
MRNLGYQIGRTDLLLQLSVNQIGNKFWTLIYIRSGVGMCLIDEQLMCLNEGDILFFPPGLAYSFDSEDLGDEYNENVDVVICRFDSSWLDSLLKTFRSLSREILALKEYKNPLMVVGPKWMKMSVLMSDLYRAEPHDQAVIILELIRCLSQAPDLLPLSAAAAEVQDALTKKDKIERYVSCHLYQKISLEEISSYAGMNKTYFCLFFKKHYGMSFTDFLNKKRIDEASLMLMNPVASIAEVATACGFPTVTYFNRIFRKYKGMTPTEYRKSQKVD